MAPVRFSVDEIIDASHCNSIKLRSRFSNTYIVKEYCLISFLHARPRADFYVINSMYFMFGTNLGDIFQRKSCSKKKKIASKNRRKYHFWVITRTKVSLVAFPSSRTIFYCP